MKATNKKHKISLHRNKVQDDCAPSSALVICATAPSADFKFFIIDYGLYRRCRICYLRYRLFRPSPTHTSPKHFNKPTLRARVKISTQHTLEMRQTFHRSVAVCSEFKLLRRPTGASWLPCRLPAETIWGKSPPLGKLLFCRRWLPTWNALLMMRFSSCMNIWITILNRPVKNACPLWSIRNLLVCLLYWCWNRWLSFFSFMQTHAGFFAGSWSKPWRNCAVTTMVGLWTNRAYL